MRVLSVLVLLVVVAGRASAEPELLRKSLQLDLGLAVVGAGYEQPLGRHVALMAEAQVFSTYFGPWFDVGDRVDGFGLGLRATYFARATGRGFYLTPYLRGDAVRADGDQGLGWSAGVAAGWAIGLGRKVDLRVGAGVQYLRYRLDNAVFDAPFVQLDLLLAYRL